MVLTKGFMALKSEKIDALSGAIPALKEIIWRKKALSPHVGTSYPHLKKRKLDYFGDEVYFVGVSITLRK